MRDSIERMNRFKSCLSKKSANTCGNSNGEREDSPISALVVTILLCAEKFRKTYTEKQDDEFFAQEDDHACAGQVQRQTEAEGRTYLPFRG